MNETCKFSSYIRSSYMDAFEYKKESAKAVCFKGRIEDRNDSDEETKEKTEMQ